MQSMDNYRHLFEKSPYFWTAIYDNSLREPYDK